MKQDICSNYTPSVGAFVFSVEHLQCLQQLDVYHWLIRPYEHLRHCVVKEVASLLHPSDLDLSTEHTPFSSPIFSGRFSDTLKYLSIRDYSRNCIRFPDPFHCRVTPEILAHSGGPSRSQSSNRKLALTSRQRQFKGGSDR